MSAQFDQTIGANLSIVTAAPSNPILNYIFLEHEFFSPEKKEFKTTIGALRDYMTSVQGNRYFESEVYVFVKDTNELRKRAYGADEEITFLVGSVVVDGIAYVSHMYDFAISADREEERLRRAGEW